MSALNSLVAESIDVVVHCARGADGPVVTEILAVEDQATGPGSTQFTVSDLFRRPRAGEPLRWTGQLPTRAARAFEEAGEDLHRLLGVPDQVVPARRDPHADAGAVHQPIDERTGEQDRQLPGRPGPAT